MATAGAETGKPCLQQAGDSKQQGTPASQMELAERPKTAEPETSLPKGRADERPSQEAAEQNRKAQGLQEQQSGQPTTCLLHGQGYRGLMRQAPGGAGNGQSISSGGSAGC